MNKAPPQVSIALTWDGKRLAPAVAAAPIAMQIRLPAANMLLAETLDQFLKRD